VTEIALHAATGGDYAGKYQFDFGAVLDVVLKRMDCRIKSGNDDRCG
jgi:hypothetical protein